MSVRSILLVTIASCVALAGCAYEVPTSETETKSFDDPAMQFSTWKLTVEEIVQVRDGSGEVLETGYFNTDFEDISLSRISLRGSNLLARAERGPSVNLATDSCVYAGELDGGFPERSGDFIGPTVPNAYTMWIKRNPFWADDLRDRCDLKIPLTQLQQGTFDIELECVEHKFVEGRGGYSLLEQFIFLSGPGGTPDRWEENGQRTRYTFRVSAERSNEDCSSELRAASFSVRFTDQVSGGQRRAEQSGSIQIGRDPQTAGILAQSRDNSVVRWFRADQEFVPYLDADLFQDVDLQAGSVRLIPGVYTFRTTYREPVSGGQGEAGLMTDVGYGRQARKVSAYVSLPGGSGISFREAY